MTFSSTDVSKLEKKGEKWNVMLAGKLKLHGVEKTIHLPVTVGIAGNELIAQRELFLLQTDYGNYASEGSWQYRESQRPTAHPLRNARACEELVRAFPLVTLVFRLPSLHLIDTSTRFWEYPANWRSITPVHFLLDEHPGGSVSVGRVAARRGVVAIAQARSP